MCTTFLVKPKSKSETKMITTLSYWLSVNPENKTSRELIFRAPDPKHLSKNSQNFTVVTWLSYLQLSCWTFSQEMLLILSKKLISQTATTRQKNRYFQTQGSLLQIALKILNSFYSIKETCFATILLTGSTSYEFVFRI